MSKYFDFVEWASPKSVRPKLIANLIHGFTAFIILVGAFVLYRLGWHWYGMIAIVCVVILLIVIRNKDDMRLARFIGARKNVNEDESLYLDENGVPFVYDELPHGKRFAKKAATYIALFVLGVALLVGSVVSLPLPMLDGIATVWLFVAGLLLTPPSFYLVCREFYRYRDEPTHCDPNDGLLIVHQANSVFPWFIKGSTPDPYSLDEFVPFTPDQTTLEWLVFRGSQTLQLKTGSGPEAHVVLELKDMRNIQHLTAIQKYRESLQAKEVRQGASMVELLTSIDNRLGLILAHMNGGKPLSEDHEPTTTEFRIGVEPPGEAT